MTLWFNKKLASRRSNQTGGRYIYAVDIGGSSIKGCLISVTEGKPQIKSRTKDVPLETRKFTELQQTVLSLVANALKDTPKLSAVGISTTGSVDRSGVVISAGHFEDYAHVSWEEILTRKFRQIKRVAVANDGRASAWGEYSAEEGGAASHIHAVVGTGVGGGIIYGNELMMGDSGQAGYLGHIKIVQGQTAVCSCGKTGCVEVLASAPAIVRGFHSRTQTNASFEKICELAKSGDNEARSAFSDAGYFLGIGLGNAMNVLNPSLVSVGGGVLLASQAIGGEGDGGPYFASILRGIQFAAHKRVVAAAKLRRAAYGNDGGMIGAALLASE